MHYGLLEEFLLMLVLAAGAVAVFRQLRLPGIIGYLLVGAVFGPTALGLFSDPDQMWFVAQLGVVFLLFTIGLEFSFAEMSAMRRTLLPLGLGQVVLTTMGVAIIAWLMGFHPAAAFAVGAILAQSSTSIISKQLLEQGEQTARHGRLGIGISVFQDVTAIPFVIAIPALAVGGLAWIGELGWAMLLATIVAAGLWATGRWLLRPMFRSVARTRSLELFTLVALAVAIGSAWLTDKAGLSLALGGFLAGMVLSETEFQHQVEAAIRPFRDILLGLFFITIGMQLDVHSLLPLLQWIIPLSIGTVVFKTALVWLLCRLTGVDHHRAIRTGLLLAVGGEFGFALIAIALDAGILEEAQKQILLGAVFLSMALTPLLIRYNLVIADMLSRYVVDRGYPQADGVGLQTPVEREAVVLCGYGRVGQNIGRFLDSEDIPFVAVDMDLNHIREAVQAGYRVHYGDARDPRLLEGLGVQHARLVVVSFDDLPAAETAVERIRELNESVPILVRTRDDSHIDRLRKAGATETISEIMEASLMMVSHALHLSGIPADRIDQLIREARGNRYQILHELFAGTVPLPLDNTTGQGEQLISVLIPEHSKLDGMPISALPLADNTQVSALVRNDQRIAKPDPEELLCDGDLLILFGPPDELEAMRRKIGGDITPTQ